MDAICILIVGMMMPFVGDILFTIQKGLQQSLYIQMLLAADKNDNTWIMILLVFNFIPVILCTLCCYCDCLRWCRYIPAPTIYFLIALGHYSISWDALTEPLSRLTVFILPFLLLPIFSVVLGLAITIAYYGWGLEIPVPVQTISSDQKSPVSDPDFGEKTGNGQIDDKESLDKTD